MHCGHFSHTYIYIYIYVWILLICAFRHTLISIFEKKNSRIEKVITAFSILDKIFLKIENLIYAFRAHINWTLYIYWVMLTSALRALVIRIYFKKILTSLLWEMKKCY